MRLKSLLLTCLFLCGLFNFIKAQTCDPNVDFETGTPSNWQYYQGTISPGPVYSLTPTPHDPIVHTIMSGSTVDPFGGFPVEGQGLYSLRLGHDSDNLGAKAMSASYYVHVPTTGTYSIIYHYAIVMQEPSHSISDEPRFEAWASDSITGSVIPYSTTSLIPISPGFITSSSPRWGGVHYKPWSTGVIDLTGYSGRTVTAQFIGAGCADGGHFGYAYVDMDCLFASDIQLLCTDATATLTAPSGYASYNWTDAATFTASISTTASVTIAAPTTTTKYAVIITPYHGHGTADTLYTTVHTALETHQTRDTTICLGESIDLTTGAIDRSPLTYSWTPSTGLSCTTCDTTIATPPLGTTKYLATVTDALGCTETDTINITVAPAIAPISGIKSACTGATTMLSDATSGGVWSSSSSSTATVGSSSGIVSCMSAGTTTITYTLSCAVITTVTVYTTPSVISGPATVCERDGIILSDAVTGGVWSSSNTSIATVVTLTGGKGVVGGAAAGTATITYTTGGTCIAMKTVTVLPAPLPIASHSSFLCPGATLALSDATPGGIWTSADVTIATVGSTSGLVTELSLTGASTTIYYTLSSGCKVSTGVVGTILPLPIKGTGPLCVGSMLILVDSSSSGMWSSSSTTVAPVDVSGVVTGISPGTATISYTVWPSCSVTVTVTVDPTPMSMSTSVYSSCGSMDTLNATGGVSYIWSPSTGLSCSTCATTTVSPTITTTYYVTGTNSLGCTITKGVTVNGNRIYGHITFSSWAPDTLDMKVWLIRYDPTDSSIVALDSMLTCTMDSIGYYEFNGKPTGNYFVKAKLIHGKPVGSSGYIPTYGLSSAYWSSATNISHSYLSDSLHITMIYGTVPSGPGFIGGYVYSGAGKGTSGETLYPDMLMYLKDATTGKILTHTYTDTKGAYSFSNIANGNYIVYPEEYQFNTTPSSTIMLTTSNESVTNVNFKRHVNPIYKITPWGIPSSTAMKQVYSRISIFPNPTNSLLNIQWSELTEKNVAIIISDVVGRLVYKLPMDIKDASGQQQINVKGIPNGLYLISVKGTNINYSSKLIIEK